MAAAEMQGWVFFGEESATKARPVEAASFSMNVFY